MDRAPSPAERELARLRAEAERLETEVSLASLADEAEAELPQARNHVAALRAELDRLTA
ncbi:MAG: hypothetical protein AAGK21_03970 [Bacteroidota bacterium]